MAACSISKRFGAWDETDLCASIIDALNVSLVNGYPKRDNDYGTNGLTDDYSTPSKFSRHSNRVLIAFRQRRSGHKAIRENTAKRSPS